jgi:eukaryotic-like serine/threonine-protein kinase
MSDTRPAPGWWQASDGKWYPPQPSGPPRRSEPADEVEPEPMPLRPPRFVPPPPPTVADHQLGPGWWLASDGRWYPPHLAGRASAPASIGPATWAGSRGPGTAVADHGRRAVAGGLGGTVQGFFWAVSGLALVAAVCSVVAMVAFDAWWDTPIGSVAEAEALDDWVTADDAFALFAGACYLAALVEFILLVVWTYQAHAATAELSPGPRSWSSGWAVGAWFVPVANLLLPKLVLNEVERISLAPRAGGAVQYGWQRRAVLAVGWWWWVPYVAGLVVTTIGAGIGDDVDSSAGEVRMSYVLTAVGFAAVAAGAACGVFYVRRIGRRLSASGLAEEP